MCARDAWSDTGFLQSTQWRQVLLISARPCDARAATAEAVLTLSCLGSRAVLPPGHLCSIEETLDWCAHTPIPSSENPSHLIPAGLTPRALSRVSLCWALSPQRENLGEHSRALFIVNAITFAYVVAAELFLWRAAGRLRFPLRSSASRYALSRRPWLIPICSSEEQPVPSLLHPAVSCRIREQWVKRHFRSDRQIAYAALQSEGSPAVDPAVAATLAQLDAMAKALAKGALLLCTGNLIASSQYLLAPDRLFGYRTILHLLANTLLIVWDVIGLFRRVSPPSHCGHRQAGTL